MNTLCVVVAVLGFYIAGTVAVCPTDHCIYCENENRCAICEPGYDRVQINEEEIGCAACAEEPFCRLCKTSGGCKLTGCSSDPEYVSYGQNCLADQTLSNCVQEQQDNLNNQAGCIGCPTGVPAFCTGARDGYYIDSLNGWNAAPCSVQGCKFCFLDTDRRLLGDVCIECEDDYEYEVTQVNKPTCTPPDLLLARFELIKSEAVDEIQSALPVIDAYYQAAVALNNAVSARDTERKADLRALRSIAISGDLVDLVSMIDDIKFNVTEITGLQGTLETMTTNQITRVGAFVTDLNGYITAIEA